MIGCLFARAFLFTMVVTAATVTVVALALLVTDLDRHVEAVAVLPGSVTVAVVAGLGLWAPRRGAR